MSKDRREMDVDRPRAESRGSPRFVILPPRTDTGVEASEGKQ